MAETLVPDILGSVPPNLPRIVRDFCRHFEAWLSYALEGQPINLQTKKIQGKVLPLLFPPFLPNIFSDINTLCVWQILAGRSFAGRVWREICVREVSACTRALLLDHSLTDQMIGDWETIDFHFVNLQACSST